MKTFKVTIDVSCCISHFGADVPGIGVENVMEWLHSDTLFSALVHGWARTKGFEKTEKMISGFTEANHDFPFRISSAFLATGDLHFVPKPLCPLPGGAVSSVAHKVKFISQENLYKWLGLTTVDWEKELTAFENSLEHDAGIYQSCFLSQVRAVNAKDRVYAQTQVYHRGETIYTEGTKLYFYADVHADYEDDFFDILNFVVEYAGFGGEINIGFSHFNGVTWEEMQPQTRPERSQQHYLLSLCSIPTNTDWNSAYYDVLTRKGWFNSPFHGTQLKKKSVKFLTEGSVLPGNPGSGKLINVTPGEWQKEKGETTNWHPIYRNGIGYFLPFG